MTDSHQFEAFVKAYQNMVFSTARRLLGNDSEAEDISQEVFLKAYERFEDLKESSTLGGWLKTVTRNLCLNHLTRYRARWRFFSEMTVGDGEEESEMQWAAPDRHEEELTRGDQRQVLESALQKLPKSSMLACRPIWSC